MNIQVTTKATTAVAYAIIFLSVSSFGQSLTWKLAVAPAQPGQVSVCSSFDGTKLAAVSSNNGIYISTNSGAHWTQIPMSANWSCIACSSDGTKLVAAAQPGSIYVSTNSGATWSVTGAPVEMWEAVASSSDGTRLVAATDGGYQLQVANGMVGWTPFGAAFSATNTTLTPVAIWNESKTNQMFFRLLMSQ